MSDKKIPAEKIQFMEGAELSAESPDQTAINVRFNRRFLTPQEVIENVQRNMLTFRADLEKDFDIPSETASDLVSSMGALSVEFNQFLEIERQAAKRTGRQLRLSDLIGFFFLSGGFEFRGDFRVPHLYNHDPCDFSYLNEFLLTTYSWEIPFVYLAGSVVEVLNIPNVDFWMDFKATLEGTGDWRRIQTRSMDRIEAESVVAHAAKSAFSCLLDRLDIDHPPGALSTLFRVINLPRLMEILVGSITDFDNDGQRLDRIDHDSEYEWNDLLYSLGRFSGPTSLCISSTAQIDELMNIYRNFKGPFSGLVIDQHGILRSRECMGWSRYVQFRAQFSGSPRAAGRTFH